MGVLGWLSPHWIRGKALFAVSSEDTLGAANDALRCSVTRKSAREKENVSPLPCEEDTVVSVSSVEDGAFLSVSEGDADGMPADSVTGTEDEKVP